MMGSTLSAALEDTSDLLDLQDSEVRKGSWAYACNLARGRKRQKDKGLKGTLGYIVISRLARVTLDLVFKKKKDKQILSP